MRYIDRQTDPTPGVLPDCHQSQESPARVVDLRVVTLNVSTFLARFEIFTPTAIVHLLREEKRTRSLHLNTRQPTTHGEHAQLATQSATRQTFECRHAFESYVSSSPPPPPNLWPMQANASSPNQTPYVKQTPHELQKPNKQNKRVLFWFLFTVQPMISYVCNSPFPWAIGSLCPSAVIQRMLKCLPATVHHLAH